MAATAPAESLTTEAVDRPPYALAAIAFAVVLLGYIFTLAPTVTFWDAGEFIATSHILGVPHPPGTPLFIMLAHTWDALIPWLPTAYKLNLMNAIFSAGCSGFLFLFMHEALRAGTGGMDPRTAKLFRVGGAFAATLTTAFAFTVWQVSIDTGKVYPVAMFLIGFSIWLTWMWRKYRHESRGAHLQLLITYILGLALANHLIGLLGGPALFAFMFYTLRNDPAKNPAVRSVEWSRLFIMMALWVFLVGLSTGSAGKNIMILGALLYAGALAYAIMCGTWVFGIAAIVAALLGVSTYAFLYIRAGLHPFINEADAASIKNLWAVIGREQYPPRSPFDNPMFESSRPGWTNPGRLFQPYSPDDPTSKYFTLRIVGLQFLNWLQYFDWQWASSLMRDFTLLAPARIPFTIGFILLGVLGAMEHRKWDQPSFALIATLFLTTSVGLVTYLNFKPGFSIGLGSFPDREWHEVRERDYFFTISFLTWGLWAGLGIASLFFKLRGRLGDPLKAAPVLGLALVPFALNFHAANRRFGPAATLAHDFAYDMLQSVEPYGILFTNGDNDTFPLWYIQEVEGFRQDVMVVNLSLVNTDWYIRQLRDLPARPYRPDSVAARLYGPSAGPPPTCSPAQQDTLDAWARSVPPDSLLIKWPFRLGFQVKAHGRQPPDRRLGMSMCLHTLNDRQIETLEPRLLPGYLNFKAGPIEHTYQPNTPFYVKDIMMLRIIQENWGRRPIYFAITAGSGNREDLDAYVTQRGLDFKLNGDTVREGAGMIRLRGFGPGWPIVDVPMTEQLVHHAYRYARLFDVPKLNLEPTDDQIASNLALPIWALAEAKIERNDVQGTLKELEQVAHLLPGNRDVQLQIQQLRAVSVLPPAAPRADTSKRDSGSGRRGR